MSRKSHSFGHAEQIISHYEDNQKRLAEMKQNARDDAYNGTTSKPELMIFGKGKTGDPTSVKALLLFDPQIQHLEEAVLAVKRALEDFEDDPRYDALHTIIDLYYWKGTHTIRGAAEVVSYSEQQAGRLKNLYVRRVCDYLGW
jgi:hypothetical protein